MSLHDRHPQEIPSRDAPAVWAARTREAIWPLAIEWDGRFHVIRRIQSRCIDLRTIPPRHSFVLSGEDGRVYCVSHAEGGWRWSLDLIVHIPDTNGSLSLL